MSQIGYWIDLGYGLVTQGVVDHPRRFELVVYCAGMVLAMEANYGL